MTVCLHNENITFYKWNWLPYDCRKYATLKKKVNNPRERKKKLFFYFVKRKIHCILISSSGLFCVVLIDSQVNLSICHNSYFIVKHLLFLKRHTSSAIVVINGIKKKVWYCLFWAIHYNYINALIRHQLILSSGISPS
jgi:hypothetical protein